MERAVEHDSPATLLVLVAEHLRARRLLRPPVDTLAFGAAAAVANLADPAEREYGRSTAALASPLRELTRTA